MAFIEWEERFSIGLKEIDSQHRTLIGLINALDALKDNTDKAALDKILNTLIEYTKTHFYNEEQMLKNMHYPEYDAHHIKG